ncbi:hypothetical protein [Brevundimonas halotolerans]|uniref:DUF3617 family protein n=1 Tax=Brevundimonas halotolerans TaxID=69670 RepID=A0A7W9A1Q8_9CAUL|nr:hypothetical protein [Brevundimonas halotolerans]MBB5659809.1 hypothetical protein [Brevundimonas halotolerans]
MRRLLASLFLLALSAAPAMAQESAARTRPSFAVDADGERLVADARLDCSVREVDLRGYDASGDGLYEIACREGAGYLILDARPAVVHPCLMLQGIRLDRRPNRMRQANPPQCQLVGNTDPVPELTARARDAGVDCEIDAVAVLGLDADRHPLIEVGCRDRDGAWLEGADSRTVTSCLVVEAQGGECGFTDAAERAREVQLWLAGTEAAACDVTEAAFRGRTPDAGVYEARCRAGDGLTFERTGDGRLIDIRSCEESAAVGRPCALTPLPADRDRR